VAPELDLSPSLFRRGRLCCKLALGQALIGVSLRGLRGPITLARKNSRHARQSRPAGVALDTSEIPGSIADEIPSMPSSRVPQRRRSSRLRRRLGPIRLEQRGRRRGIGRRQAPSGRDRGGRTRLHHRARGSGPGPPGRLRRRGPRPRREVRRQVRGPLPGPDRLPQAAGAQGHRRGHHRHARPLARQDRHRRHEGRQGRLLREAAHADHRRGQADLQGGRAEQAGLPGGHAAALQRPVLPARRGIGPQRPAGQAAQGDLLDRQRAGQRSVPRLGPAPGPRLGPMARPGPQGALHAPALPRHVSLVAGVLRRQADRLGRPPRGHRPVGDRVRAHRPGRNPRQG